MNGYLNVMPIEQPDIISAYSIPGMKPKKRRNISQYWGQSIVSISAKYGYMLFSLEATELMKLKESDKLRYIILDSMICIYKSDTGLSVWKGDSGGIKTQSRPLGRVISEALKNASRNSNMTLRYSVVPTESYIQDSQLFELRPPSNYKKYLSSLIIPSA